MDSARPNPVICHTNLQCISSLIESIRIQLGLKREFDLANAFDDEEGTTTAASIDHEHGISSVELRRVRVHRLQS